ncbi:hypothetical protein G6F46_007212 [Rhizopus delemar]|uniref:F-box domain-containing protein n=2 Tax=Rhizopus TaxID=4842 RepID=A0A9P7CP15_9FUNG|nr:hypothetical protein G6F55_011514 [Rhizopus delemar]KAG1542264.1 hypothetical protein G6F51_007378 [Rhizopus arrhizus]KAG1489401.1 hypothetical protein G6F54_011465 [Rhizopus delemar]KAG1498195.1 hypothetical protein G6F53_011797 [Rhizopus delemar]KAG1515613.1 hypothetical protein G6F52_009639 [Rhizopus delemar]
MTVLIDLPKEVISMVFGMLEKQAIYQCLFVNKKFYSVSVTELWKAPEIHSREALLQFMDELKLSRVKIGSKIKCITIHCEIKDAWFLNIVHLVPNLEELAIGVGGLLTGKTTVQIFRYCKWFKTLRLGYSEISQRPETKLMLPHSFERLIGMQLKVNSENLRSFIHLPIENLTLNGQDWTDGSKMVSIMRTWTHLTHLTLGVSMNFACELLRCMTTDAEGMPCLPQLQSFYVASPHGRYYSINIGIDSFLKTHSHIHELSLFLGGISDSILIYFAGLLPDLTVLRIDHSERISVQIIHDIACLCPKLSNLEMFQSVLIEDGLPRVHESSGYDSLKLNRVQIDQLRASCSARIFS